MWQIEVAGRSTVFSPGLYVVSVGIELNDARVAVPIGNVDLAILPEGNISWLVEEPISLSGSIDAA
jgi:hypothetical protein